jgi:hypothetical protein
MDTQEYERAKRKLHDKHKAELAADLELLDRLYLKLKDEPTEATSNGHTKHESEKPPDQHPPRTGVGKGMVIRGVRDIFNKSPSKEFAAKDLTDILISQGTGTTKASVNGAITRLVEQGFLEVTVQGIGRRASRFRKK